LPDAEVIVLVKILLVTSVAMVVEGEDAVVGVEDAVLSSSPVTEAEEAGCVTSCEKEEFSQI